MNAQDLEAVGTEKLNKVKAFAEKVISDYKSKDAIEAYTGISSSSVYDFKNGAWQRISLKVFNQILAKMNEDVSFWKDVKTRNFQVIEQAVKMQATMRRMSAIVAETGSGKTFAAKLIAQKTDCAYMMVDATMNQYDFLSEVLTALGVHNAYAYRGLREKMKKAVSVLVSRDVPVLIIDDAGKMKDGVLKLIQVLYDHTVDKAGILLIGTPTLKKRIESYADVDKCYCRELIGRIADWKELTYPKADEVAEICQKNGIGNALAIAWLTHATFSLHTLTDIIKKANVYGAKTGVDITSEILININKDLTWQNKNYGNVA